jgi:hypothetical protein
MSDVLQIHGPEQSLLNPSLPDGGLPPAVGVHNFQIFRATKDLPAHSDQLGYTYHHHVDMACWKSRLYVAWNSCEKDEDVWPSRELYSTSDDGSTWTSPAELFPQGISTALRMYFYHASNGRMLAIAGLRTNHDDTDENLKTGLVVREIRSDQALGEVFTLQADQSITVAAPRFDESRDDGFKQACQQLLSDRIFLEQQDRGRLLGQRKMEWHDASSWPNGKVPGDNEKWTAGKAYSFFQRPDHTWIGISKMGWTTTSQDDGTTWTQPSVPHTLITGKAKVWSQRTPDGRYALVYNPSKSNRYPLVVVTSRDGINFGEMRVIQGELPIQRYAGEHRSIGPQYVRGVSRWADDGSRHEYAIWLAYSMNKEDIWVSRVPLPVFGDQRQEVADFKTLTPGPFVPWWNIYRPKWSTIEIENGSLLLQNRDPYDYARVTRVFPDTTQLAARFTIQIDHLTDPGFEIDISTKFGSRRPVRLRIDKDGNLTAAGQHLVTLAISSPVHFEIALDTIAQKCAISINGTPAALKIVDLQPNDLLNRITFRTGPHRGIGGATPIPPGTDRPTTPTTVRIHSVTLQNKCAIT